LDAFQVTFKEVFQYRTSIFSDVLLKCLDMSWELHRPYLRKADALSHLLHGATYTLDEYIKKNHFYSNPTQEGVHCSNDLEMDQTEGGLSHPKHIAEKRQNNMTVIELKIDDHLITKNGKSCHIDDPLITKNGPLITSQVTLMALWSQKW
jgi:hypothetical protein